MRFLLPFSSIPLATGIWGVVTARSGTVEFSRVTGGVRIPPQPASVDDKRKGVPRVRKPQ